MQKINFEDKPSTTTPIDADNLNLLQDNVEEAIGLTSNYFTRETVIGKWKDGKPLYRRVLDEVESPSVLNTYTPIVDLRNNNIDTMLPLKGTLYAEDGRELSINHSEPNYTIATTYFSGRIEMKIESNIWKERRCIIIIEYTKTTD